MTAQPMTPAEAASALYTLLSRYLSAEMLSDYGIEVTEAQAVDVTRETLSFNLYWVSAAINAHIPRQYREVLFGRLLDLIRADWGKEFKQDTNWNQYLNDMEERRSLYAPVGDLEGGFMAAAEELAGILEDAGLLQAEDRSKLLVLLPDVVPLDKYRTLLDECT
jgi:hypothetical protein